MNEERHEYEVYGSVTGRDGTPLRGARVAVWWQHIRERSELTAGSTSEDGRYYLRYRVPENAPPPVLIVVEALSEHLDEPLFSALTEAQQKLEIDLSYEPPDQSEWATLLRSIEPLLGGLKLSELVESKTHHDISFLARELSKDTETVMRVAVAARLGVTFKIPAPAFYAFLRQRVPAALPSPLLDASQNFTLIDALVHTIGSLIFGLTAEVQSQTLTAAIALDFIGSQFTDQIAKLVSELQAQHTTDLLNQPNLAGNASLAQLLDVAALAPAKQQAFAQALATNTQTMRGFWRTLGDGKHGFTAAEASAVERSLTIGAFVRNFVPLVQNLAEGFASGTYQILPDLARLSKQDWIQLVEQTGPPPGVQGTSTASPAQIFAGIIYARVTRAYPTVALSSRITGGNLVPPPQQQPLIRFSQNNSALELIQHNIPAYLADHPDAFAGIGANDRAAVVANARSFQRILRVAPSPDVAEALLGLSITSAAQIAAMGRQQFSAQATAVGVSTAETDQAFQAAVQRYANTVSLYLQLNRDSLGLWPQAMGGLAALTETEQQAIRRDPSLATLFGSQDYCATDDCTSILSPAAYLCDLLLWLRNRPQGTRTALDVLDGRRPDIRHLLLDCPNTDTELPYIDLVNELLADKISPPIDSIATSYTQAALVNGTTYYYLVTAVNQVGESASSAQASATPAAPTAAPAAPTGTTATPGDAQVTISWNPVAGATSYNIYWSTTPGVTTATGTKITGAVNPYVQAALVNGTTYYYLVTAVNQVGESASSAQASATPAAPTAAPAAPTGTTATPGDAQVTISWNPVAGATSYNIYWSTTPGVTTATGTKITGAVNPYVQAALVNGTTYYYLVTAVNQVGESASSAQASATPAAPTAAPAAPTGTTAMPGDAQVTISWNPVAGATSYNIYWSTTPGVTTATGTKITGSWNPRWKQTSANKTTAELSAAPEYFNQGAYITLFGASYPFTLPYSAGLDGLRTYLQQLKLPLWQLRQALLPLSGATAAEKAAVAAERFGMAPHAEDLVANQNFVPAPVAWNTANPSTDLVAVPAFLQAASLTYESLLELLQVAWVQGEVSVAIQGLNDTCDTSVQTLGPSPLDAGFLDRAHRFLRLWLSSGYKMWELDLLLGTAQIAVDGILDQDALVALLAFRQLQDATGLAVDRQLAFYQNIDTAAHRDPDGTTTTSLYAQIFLNPAVTSVAPDPDLAVLPTGGTIADPVLSDHLPAIQAALGVSAADATTLFGLTDDQLTLANLSFIYRVSALAAASRFSISDLLTTADLLTAAANPVDALAPLFASPAATLAFLTQATTVQKSGLSLDALTYLLTPPPATVLTTGITAAQTSIMVASDTGFPRPNFYISVGSETMLVTEVGGAGNTTWTVQRGQQGTTAAVAAGGATIGLTAGWATTTQMTRADIATALSAVRQAVASLLSTSTALAASIDSVQTSITVTSDAGFPAPNFSVAIGSEIVLVTEVGGVGNTTWTVQRGQQGTTAAAAAAGAAVTPTGGDVNGAVIAAVAANAHTANNAALANDVTAHILNTLLLPGTAQTLLATLTDQAFTGSSTPITQANFPGQFLAIQLFDKTAVLVRALHLVTKDLTWLLANVAAYGGLDITQLPVTPDQPTQSLPPLLTTLLLIKLARLWIAAPPASAVQTLYDIIGGVSAGTLASETAVQTALATITGWPLSDVTSFGGALGLAFPGGYEAPATYDALHTLEAMATAAGASGSQIVNWGTVPPDEPTAEGTADGVLAVLKAQQPGNDAWLTLAATLMNPLRDRRSAALRACLIAQHDSSGNLVYGDPDGLFDYFLIDVQMTSCQLTSRVVQAYIAIQTFVERCLMNLEAPAVVVDDSWNQWEWMSRYRIWEANREVFLYPENWLIESQRPNRTEIYQKLEQEVHQGQSTADHLETVVLNYIGRLDDLARLQVSGTCTDPATGTIYVVARTLADPPIYYQRSCAGGAWTGWSQIPLDIKAPQAVPAVYRGQLCLFWLDVKISNEPQQPLPAAQQGPPPPQNAERYVTLGVFFSIFRDGAWTPAQASKGKLFDKPLLDPTKSSETSIVAGLYSIKVETPAAAPGYGANLWVDVFRLGDYEIVVIPVLFGVITFPYMNQPNSAVHVGRAVFDGRFGGLELNNLSIFVNGTAQKLLSYAQATYGPDAQPLLALTAPDPDLAGEPNLIPQSGALATSPAPATAANPTQQLALTSINALEQNVGPLLNAAPLPFRVVGPDSDLNFDPASDFFFQDNQRCYWVESQKLYWTGSFWSPVVPSSPASVSYEIKYVFHPFYHPFTRLFWNQLAGGGFGLLYDPNLQQNPDQIDPSGADIFSFQTGYQPATSRVWWDHDDITGQDRQFLDFGYGATFSVYNWELFYHVPLYIAQLLSQNQQFEDAQTWFRYIFDPTRTGDDPVPQRFWIPKPLHNLTSAQILAQQINNLLQAVNRGDPAAIAQVESWQNDPFNPFLLADLRNGVPYMKSTVMSYLDNLIAWGDNLFASQSREALSEATLLYIVASEILGPAPAAVTPPPHADESFDQLEPALDAFANAMVEIENVLGGAGGGGTGGGVGGIPVPQTFYFKIPSNPQLLGYWTKVADRLYKLRHCQSITGAPLQLALFDAPIDPALLIRAQEAGVDLSSVLSDLTAALPNYRFTTLYQQAADFVGAVRTYGGSLQAALEKSDSGALTLLQQTTAQQLLIDGNAILDWQVQVAQNNLQAQNEALNLAQQRYNFNNSQSFANAAEIIGTSLHTASGILKVISAATTTVGAIAEVLPNFTVGIAGFGGSPVATVNDGGAHAGNAGHMAGISLLTIADTLEIGAGVSNTIGSWQHRMDTWVENATETGIQIAQTKAQIQAATLMLQIAQENQAQHQEQIDNIQKQIDFLNSKFTSDSLYDWMVSSLSATYFQSYQLAYKMCKQLERCYQFELGIKDSSFIQFGYWDSLHKGLLAGETLNHDLRRMQASYLQQNARRYELSRFVSVGMLDPGALQHLLVEGWCDFDLPESLFDSDYPGHYNRRLTRVSVTVVYPSPGKFDNIKATLTLTANKVRINTTLNEGADDPYVESPPNDARFIYNYAAVPQKIATGNAQDDPGLFVTSISSNITDQRYLPFENAGATSSWHLEMPQLNNEVDLSTVGDIVLHLYYTALDGGKAFQDAVGAHNAANLPTSGVKLFSAQNDFAAAWQAFLAKPKDKTTNQTLTLGISAAKFPAWTRGKNITVTSVTALGVAWPPGNFILVPQPPLAGPPPPNLVMTPVAGVTEPNVCAATVTPPAGTSLGTWSFWLKQEGAGDFQSLTADEIGDVLLLVSYEAS